MESEQKSNRVLKKVKDFENVYDYFSYATTEFGDEKLHYDGYNWTADDLFDLYLAGDRDAVWKLAVPESPDYSKVPFMKSCSEPAEQPLVTGKFAGPDLVRFPCEPALTSIEKHFEAKGVDDQLIEHPQCSNWWPNRSVDLGFAKLELLEAKQNLTVTQRKYTETLEAIEKDKEDLREKAARLREFTIQYNNLAYRNLYKKKESELRIRANLEFNLQKLRDGNRMKERIESLVVVREDLNVRIGKMQMYEDYLHNAVECSNKKFDNIQQILDRYDVVSFMKRRIVRNHLRDMFQMDTHKGTLVKLVTERKDSLRNFNNQMSELARRYKFVVRRYQHWENAVHRLKKLCNKELEQTQSVDASIWNLYVQMCKRKRMPVKESRVDYKAQLAYILLTIKQYEKIVRIAEEKYALSARTKRASIVSTVRRREPKREVLELPRGQEPLIVERTDKWTQTIQICYADEATMIWWEEELQTGDTRASEFEGHDESSRPGELTMLEAAMLRERDVEPVAPDTIIAGKFAIGTAKEAFEGRLRDESRLAGEKNMSFANLDRRIEDLSVISIETNFAEGKKRLVPSKKSKHIPSRRQVPSNRPKLSKNPVPMSRNISKSVNDARAKGAQGLKQSKFQKHEKPALSDVSEVDRQSQDKVEKVNVVSQTDEIHMHDKSQQHSVSLTVHVQTLDASELQELAQEQQLLLETEQNLSWLKDAATLNRKLMGPISERPLLTAKRSVEQCLSGEYSDAPRHWTDLQADWFYPAEWRDTLVTMEEEDGWMYRRASKAGEMLPSGRRMSAAMKTNSTVMFASRRNVISSLMADSKQPKDVLRILTQSERRDSLAIQEVTSAIRRPSKVKELRRDSLAMGVSMGQFVGKSDRRQSLGPGQLESLALADIGLLHKLQLVLAERERASEQGEELQIDELPEGTKGTVFAQLLGRIMKKIRCAELAEIAEYKQEEQDAKSEAVIVKVADVRLGAVDGMKVIAKRDRDLYAEDEGVQKDDSEHAQDWNGQYPKKNNMDAWTQTPRDQTEDWVQTLPVKEAYGWTQTERIDEMTQTELEDDVDKDAAGTKVECAETGTQTDVLVEDKRVEMRQVELRPEEATNKEVSEQVQVAEEKETSVEQKLPAELTQATEVKQAGEPSKIVATKKLAEVSKKTVGQRKAAEPTDKSAKQVVKSEQTKTNKKRVDIQLKSGSKKKPMQSKPGVQKKALAGSATKKAANPKTTSTLPVQQKEQPK